MENTWEIIAQPEKPILIADLKTIIKQGQDLNFPINRSYEINAINSYWNDFVIKMANEYKRDLELAIQNENQTSFDKIMKRISGISSLYRLNEAKIKRNELSLNLGITNFKDYMGTAQKALESSEFRARLMSAGEMDHNDPNYYFANPLSTCSNIVTSDGYIPIGTRSNKVAIYPNVPHVIGGQIKVKDENNPHFNLSKINLFTSMLEELEEELSLNDNDIKYSEFMGVFRNAITRCPEMVYNISLKLTSQQLYERWSTHSKDKFEHRNISFYHKKELVPFLNKWHGKMVPIGEAALSLFLEYNP